MVERLHVAYRKYKIKKLMFLVNTKHISSRELDTSEFSTHSMKYIWYSPQKSKYLLHFVSGSVMKTICFATFVFATLYLKDSWADEDSESGIVHTVSASLGPICETPFKCRFECAH